MRADGRVRKRTQPLVLRSKRSCLAGGLAGRAWRAQSGLQVKQDKQDKQSSQLSQSQR